GKVIGVDMTPDMLARARANAEKAGVSNVEFRLGEIEHLPVADATIDAVISNCVINLSPDKSGVLREAFRVLRPGGRLAVSDIVATGELPQAVRDDLRLISACIGGAASIADLEAMIREAGFVDVAIEPSAESMPVIGEWAPVTKVEESIASAAIRALKPPASQIAHLPFEAPYHFPGGSACVRSFPSSSSVSSPSSPRSVHTSSPSTCRPTPSRSALAWRSSGC
ncbi:MAG: methyltransferase domain-containing protein, partial [Chloroflexi bacterium]|nr:methyltransferase domain-containing protein [Chloroflexota bacterium]